LDQVDVERKRRLDFFLLLVRKEAFRHPKASFPVLVPLYTLVSLLLERKQNQTSHVNAKNLSLKTH
jgi:hypothetical protein